ncbi:hypothetical protein D1007_26926 [Hordeum vulgare]|nr:hypothetical protein D1007_26926 [Hordeum vulgare]
MRIHFNLPAFFDATLVEKLNWKAQLPRAAKKVDALCRWLECMFNVEGLMVVDLFANMVSRQIHPLQYRPHLICEMSARHDPCRLLMKELRAHRVNLVAVNPMDEDDWSWGKMPYNRAHPAPMVSDALTPLLLGVLVALHA